MNELYELSRKRRSVRRYGTAHIDDEVIHEIMKVALTAPTSSASRWVVPRSTARML